MMNRRARWEPRLHIMTLALDAMPFICRHLERFESLSVPWHWHVVEGVAKNVACTSWCKPIQQRISQDGTHEYMLGLRTHPHVSFYHRPLWDGKVAMCNHALKGMPVGGILLQVDADEFWSKDGLESIVSWFESDRDVREMSFRCRYFVGPDLVVSENESIHTGVWRRAWRFRPGARFQKHEPPVLLGAEGRISLSPEETLERGLVFDHFAYAVEAQVAFKESYYGYANAVENWRQLQNESDFPVKLSRFMSWANPSSMVVKFNGRFL